MFHIIPILPTNVQQEEQWIQKGRSFHPTTTSYPEQSMTRAWTVAYLYAITPTGYSMNTTTKDAHHSDTLTFLLQKTID